MSSEFLGTWENSVNKKRIMIPAELKKKFGPNAKNSVICSFGPDAYIVVYPLDNWKKLSEKLRKGDERQRDLLNDLRDFASPEQSIEGPGRIKLTDELMELAGITDKVVIRGEGDFISVWSPEEFRRVKLERLESRKGKFRKTDYQL
ncbi:MAG: protein MraZ [Candidatus Cloacimonadota bacterium]|nr:MAG: protein MraZ [Candidatus Cloacimonadota bacterium]